MICRHGTLQVVFSCLAYAVVGSTPSGVPRRMSIPNTWDEKTNWTVAGVSCIAVLERKL